MIVSAWYSYIVLRETVVRKWPYIGPAIYRFLWHCINTMGNSCISKDHRRRTLEHGGAASGGNGSGAGRYSETDYPSSHSTPTNHNSEQSGQSLNENRQARAQVTPLYMLASRDMAAAQPTFTSDISHVNSSDDEETEHVNQLMLRTLQVIRTLVDK